ncbi:MAG: TolC family protein [Alistipes sp.]|nr:TolC family protein [Alistipes sp.]
MYAKIVAAALTAVVCCARAEAQITIEEYRAAVADHSWTLQAARSAGEETRETMLLRRTDYLPQVTATGSFTRTSRRFASLEPWTSLARLGIEQNVYSGGAVRAAARQAELAYDIALCGEQSAAFDVRYAADYAYWSLSRAESYLKAVREYIAIVGSLQKVVHRRFEEGYISKSDVLQIDSRMSDAEFGMVAAEQAYYVALHDFNVLRGQSVGQDVTLSQSILDTIDMPRRVDMATITARRPDFTASRMSIDAARWRIKSVRAAYLPKVGVGVYGAWQPYVPNSTGKTYVDGGAFISVDVPIFHFRARSHAVRSAEHAAQRSEWQSAQLYDTILTEEINGWTDIMSARAQLINSQQSLEIAAENLSISTYSYKEGLATILDVMQAQISWLQIYTNTITARFNLAVAVASYSRTTSMP